MKIATIDIYSPKSQGALISKILANIAERFQDNLDIELENALTSNDEFDKELCHWIFICLRLMTKKQLRMQCLPGNLNADGTHIGEWSEYVTGNGLGLPKFLTQLYDEHVEQGKFNGTFAYCKKCKTDNKHMEIQIKPKRKILNICRECYANASDEEKKVYQKKGTTQNEDRKRVDEHKGSMRIYKIERAPRYIKLLAISTFMRRRNALSQNQELFLENSIIKQDLKQATLLGNIEADNIEIGVDTHFGKDEVYNKRIAKASFGVQRVLADSRWTQDPYKLIQDAIDAAKKSLEIENYARSMNQFAWMNHVIERCYACIGDEKRRLAFQFNLKGIVETDKLSSEMGLDNPIGLGEYFSYWKLGGNEIGMAEEIQVRLLRVLNKIHKEMFVETNGAYELHHKHEKISGKKSVDWLNDSEKLYRLILIDNAEDFIKKKDNKGRPIELFKTRREIKSKEQECPELFKDLLDLNYNLMKKTLKTLKDLGTMLSLPTRRLVIRDCLIMFSKQVNKETNDQENKFILEMLGKIAALVRDYTPRKLRPVHKEDYTRIFEKLQEICSGESTELDGNRIATEINKLLAEEIRGKNSIKLYFPQGKKVRNGLEYY
mgnify:FL=1